MVKKDAVKILEIVTETINSLSNTEIEKLLNGQGILSFKEKATPSKQDKGMVKDITVKIRDGKDIETVLIEHGLKTKKELKVLCKSLGLKVKSRDTKVDIHKKLESFLDERRNGSVNNGDVGSELQRIADDLQTFESVDKAEDFINNHPLLKRKADLLKLAKLLDVYVKSNWNKAQLKKRIVDAVVGSKLKALTIRNRS